MIVIQARKILIPCFTWNLFNSKFRYEYDSIMQLKIDGMCYSIGVVGEGGGGGKRCHKHVQNFISRLCVKLTESISFPVPFWLDGPLLVFALLRTGELIGRVSSNATAK